MFNLRARFLTLGGVLLATTGFAQTLPDNDLYLEDSPEEVVNMTEAEFNDIVNEIVDHYKPLAEAQGGNLTAENNWADSTVNAYANQSGGEWSIHMFGGLARRPEVTKDGFAMVVCHELGHHFGGHYFHKTWWGVSWAACEGQSDYFATHACAREVWKDRAFENELAAADVDAAAQDKCDAAWETSEDRNLCYRITMAGKSLATLLGALSNGTTPPEFDTPDPRKVTQTDTKHPKAQCRLDTYFHGALCGKQYDSSVIPAKDMGDQANTREGEEASNGPNAYCSREDQDGIAARPACWFASQIK